MRILDVRDDRVDDDVAFGRRALQIELEHPARTVMIVLGSETEVSKLADRVASRADAFPWRAAVWVRDRRILTEDQRQWFEDHRTRAVALDFADHPVETLRGDSDLFTVERAFLRAQQGGAA